MLHCPHPPIEQPIIVNSRKFLRALHKPDFSTDESWYDDHSEKPDDSEENDPEAEGEDIGYRM